MRSYNYLFVYILQRLKQRTYKIKLAIIILNVTIIIFPKSSYYNKIIS